MCVFSLCFETGPHAKSLTFFDLVVQSNVGHAGRCCAPCLMSLRTQTHTQTHTHRCFQRDALQAGLHQVHDVGEERRGHLQAQAHDLCRLFGSPRCVDQLARWINWRCSLQLATLRPGTRRSRGLVALLLRSLPNDESDGTGPPSEACSWYSLSHALRCVAVVRDATGRICDYYDRSNRPLEEKLPGCVVCKLVPQAGHSTVLGTNGVGRFRMKRISGSSNVG